VFLDEKQQPVNRGEHCCVDFSRESADKVGHTDPCRAVNVCS
jgi:hypothetical protein